MTDPVVQIAFDGNPGLSFCQGEYRTVLLTFVNKLTGIPINLTGTVSVNFSQQGGGTVKRSTAGVNIPASQVNITPANTLTLQDHGFVTGDTIQVAAQAGGALPGGLSALTNYLVVAIDLNTFSLTDSSGNAIVLSSQGTIGLVATLQNDVTISNATLGQVSLVLRNQVTAVVNAALAQDFQVGYVNSNEPRIAVIQGQLDVLAQPAP